MQIAPPAEVVSRIASLSVHEWHRTCRSLMGIDTFWKAITDADLVHVLQACPNIFLPLSPKFYR